MKPLAVGMIGVGDLTLKQHLPNVQRCDWLRVDMLCDLKVERLEQEIEELEFLISEIEDQIASEEVTKDPKALEKLAKDLQDAKEALNGKYEKWLQ